MYSQPKLPFFIKNAPLNFTICYIYLYALILFVNTGGKVEHCTNYIPCQRITVGGVSQFTLQMYKLQMRSQFLLTSSTINNNVNILPVLSRKQIFRKLQSISLI